MSILNSITQEAKAPSIDTAAPCRECEKALWKPGKHRAHSCMGGGCACPSCFTEQLPEVEAVFVAVRDLMSKLPRFRPAMLPHAS